MTLGTTPRQLAFEGQNTFPVFSPDGTRHAFASNREGTLDYDLFLKNLSDDSLPVSAFTLDGDIEVRCRGCERQRQFTISTHALAQFAIAYFLIAQFGIYLHEGYGQLVIALSELIGMFG